MIDFTDFLNKLIYFQFLKFFIAFRILLKVYGDWVINEFRLGFVKTKSLGVGVCCLVI